MLAVSESVSHCYEFQWCDRGTWVLLLQRFHRAFKSRWRFVARDREDASGATDVMTFEIAPDATSDQVWSYFKEATDRFVMLDTTPVRVTVAGTAFWGAMPLPHGINWRRLPSDPLSNQAPPAHVIAYAEQVEQVAHLIGIQGENVSLRLDWTPWEKEPIAPAWFPFIIRHLCRCSEEFSVTSLFWAPSSETMYVMLELDYDATTLMVVRFDGKRAASAADVPFDINDGFSGPDVPAEMHERFIAWTLDDARDPMKPLLTLLGPYASMATGALVVA